MQNQVWIRVSTEFRILLILPVNPVCYTELLKAEFYSEVIFIPWISAESRPIFRGIRINWAENSIFCGISNSHLLWLLIRNTEFRIIPRNFSQFRIASGICGSISSIQNAVNMEFRGHPQNIMGIPNSTKVSIKTRLKI
jgi:hypothetical protein